MKNNRTFHIILGVICIAAGGFLFHFKSDAIFANLAPTEGSAYLVPMKSGNIYSQDIVIHNKVISRIGVYFLPLHPLLQHEGIIHLSLMRGDAVLESGEINSNYIDSTAPTEFVFAHPVASATDETLRIRVTVSDDISTDVALRTRTPDNDFTGDDVVFFINNDQQQYPFAYTASELLHPSLMKQIGALSIAIGLGMLAWPFFKQHRLLGDHLMLAVVALLQAFSASDSQTSAMMYGIFVFCILFLMWWIFRIVGRSRLAALFGACICACSSWVPLAIISLHTAKTQLSFKDAMLDPNQIVVSHASGAYIGFFALFFGAIGITVLILNLTRDTRRKVMLDSAVFIVLCISFVLAFAHIALTIPSVSIIVALCLGWFAALGLHAMQRFIGIHDRLAFILLAITVCIAVLDLMHVASVTLAYGAAI